MTMNRILILGSSGFIGSSLSKMLELNHNILKTYHDTAKSNDGICFNILSFDSLEKVFQKSKPDVVINLCAIYKNLKFCEENKKLVMQINGTSLRNISKLCNKFSSILIHLSSDYVFDGIKGNYKENDPVSPINLYGQSKAKAEKNIQEIAKDYCIVRTAMVYGKSNLKQTLPDWIINEAMKNKKLKIIYDQYMTPTYIDNLCKMIKEVIDLRLNGIIHLAGPQKLSRYTFAIKLLELARVSHNKIIPTKCNKFDLYEKRPIDSSLNTDKATFLLKEKPEKFEVSIEKYLSTRI